MCCAPSPSSATATDSTSCPPPLWAPRLEATECCAAAAALLRVAAAWLSPSEGSPPAAPTRAAGAFVLMLARELPLRAVVSQIMALPPAMLQGYNGTPFPPTLFLHMPRDGRTAALVSKCVGRLSQQGRPVAEIGAAPQPAAAPHAPSPRPALPSPFRRRSASRRDGRLLHSHTRRRRPALRPHRRRAVAAPQWPPLPLPRRATHRAHLTLRRLCRREETQAGPAPEQVARDALRRRGPLRSAARPAARRARCARARRLSGGGGAQRGVGAARDRGGLHAADDGVDRERRYNWTGGGEAARRALTAWTARVRLARRGAVCDSTGSLRVSKSRAPRTFVLCVLGL